MQEDFLHFIWRFQYYNLSNLQTASAQAVVVHSQGTYQNHSGPDFENAKVRIGEVQWAGNIEIHIRASDWYVHSHHKNPAYNNVVLHVVWQNDRETCNEAGQVIPVLELKNRVDQDLIFKYRKLTNSGEIIHCSRVISSTSELYVSAMISRAAGERLEFKSANIIQLLEKNAGDWEETAYQVLARNFGFKVNADTFLELARRVPFRIVKKHAVSVIQLEALLFGQAGFLVEESEEDYFQKLKKEYDFLANKYDLKKHSLHKFQWKFLRLRPPNFPTVRIAQFASFIVKFPHLFRSMISKQAEDMLSKDFSIQPSDYWLGHYDFGKKAPMNGLGASSLQNIVVNTVTPLMVAYSRYLKEEHLMTGALNLLEKTPVERNHITKKWTSIGIKPKSAFDSQGLIMQYNQYCIKKRCLHCKVGVNLIKCS